MNTFGRLFQVSIYGESHQAEVGCMISGVPAGILLSEALLMPDLAKRKAGAIGTTPRIESDEPKIVSGVFNGYTTGSPIVIRFENRNTQSKDYSEFLKMPRPGHADFVAKNKYHNFHDYRGGGRFSGRLTLGIVSAGSIAKTFLPMTFSHELVQIGSLKDMNERDAYLQSIKEAKDSVGGIIEVKVNTMPIGLGEPFFDSIESKISAMLFSIPAVKGVEFGIGFQGIYLKGSEFNDGLIDASGKTKTNHNGGINGGISNGNELVVRVIIKPTSSIGVEQATYNFETKRVDTLKAEGRHDVCIALRAGIVIENAVAIALADLYLIHQAYKGEK